MLGTHTHTEKERGSNLYRYKLHHWTGQTRPTTKTECLLLSPALKKAPAVESRLSPFTQIEYYVSISKATMQNLL